MPFTEAVPPHLLYSGRMHPDSIHLWGLSQNRRFDTFIGLTDITNGQFHMRPCVKSTEDPDVYQSLFLGMSGGEQVAARTAKLAAESYYGPDAIIVVPHAMANAPQGVDGFAHMTLCNRVQVAQHDCIGWAIKGNAAGSQPPIAVFSSGRNIPHFAGLQGRPPGQQSRDLPTNWARFVLAVLKRDLAAGQFAIDQNKWPGVN